MLGKDENAGQVSVVNISQGETRIPYRCKIKRDTLKDGLEKIDTL